MTETPTRRRGHPVERPMPEPIYDAPENIARTIMAGSPKIDRDYLKAKSPWHDE